MNIVPSTTPPIVRYEPMRVQSSRPAPIRHASAEVSPIEPGMKPVKAAHQLASASAPFVAAACESRVAPVNESTPAKSAAIHGASPLM